MKSTLYFVGHPTNELNRGEIAGIVIGTLIGVSILVYVCMQYEKMKKAKQAASNRVRSRHLQSQMTDSFLETGATAVEVADPEPSDSQLLITDTVFGLEPPGSERQPSFPQLIEPSAPTLSKTPPPSFEDADKYPTLSMELDPPPPYPGLSVSEAELQQYPLNNPTYQPSNY